MSILDLGVKYVQVLREAEKFLRRSGGKIREGEPQHQMYYVTHPDDNFKLINRSSVTPGKILGKMFAKRFAEENAKAIIPSRQPECLEAVCVTDSFLERAAGRISEGRIMYVSDDEDLEPVDVGLMPSSGCCEVQKWQKV